MKRSIIVFVLFCFAIKALSQYPKWVVQFKDKNNSPFSIQTPGDYLSPAAVERRVKYNIVVDSTDLPVNPAYITEVLSKGAVTYLSQSKWLNQILIYCTDTAVIAYIDSLPFVVRTMAVGFIREQEPGYDRFVETVQPTISTSTLLHSTSGDTLNYGTSYNQIHIHNGEYLHEKGYTGNGMTIAVLDAGFYHFKELSAFDSILSQNRLLGEKDFVDYDNSVDEDNAHGMYCLSIIGANLPGIMVGTAPHASFWLLRSENDFSEYPVEEHNWVAAAEFADSAGADLITSSLGYYYFDDSAFNHTYNDIYANTTTVSRGASMAARKGMIVTNSAGNEGNNSWHYIIFPSDADSVCTVGAVNSAGEIAPFSSYGFPGEVKPNIVSVGSGTTIFGINNMPATGSGTSFSNPNINGLIACLWEAFPAYNNLTVLNAVYQSSDRYNNPDNRYGFGIPDMKKAYLILKAKQNLELYGNEWLFANPNPFTNRIDVKLIGQVNSNNVQIILQDANGNTISSILLTTEEQEVYDTAFINLDNLPPGQYFLKYTDGLNSKTIELTKNGTEFKDWLVAVPVPFTSQLTVYFKAPENGQAILRLTDGAGRILETVEVTTIQSYSYTVSFKTATMLPHGVYFIQYIGEQKRTIKVIK